MLCVTYRQCIKECLSVNVGVMSISGFYIRVSKVRFYIKSIV